jgi:serine protease Do
MGFHEDSLRPGWGCGAFLLVLLGAVLGTALTLAAVFYAGFPASPAARDPFDHQAPRPGDGDSPLLPEYQNTAVVQAARSVTPAVVGISNRKLVYEWFRGSSELREVGTGSGVIINADGLIVTNNHVIQDAAEVVVIFADGDEVQAEIVGADAATDLAVLKVERQGLTAASFGDSDLLQVGELAIAIGNPLGLAFQQTVTLGVISATERFIQASEYRFAFIQTDAAINPGNSGGALVNLKGQVVGINTAKINLPGFEGMGFAIPSNMVKDIVRELVEYGRVIRPWMGVEIQEITPQLAESLGLPVTAGVLVARVVANSPAARAGLREGDIIVEVGDAAVKDFDTLRRALFRYKPGNTVTVKLLREGGELNRPVTLAEMPDSSPRR